MAMRSPSSLISVSFIISLLMVVGVTCRTFSSERERQTLDLLLTTPLTNSELLKEKLSAANRTILFLMVPILVAGMTHLMIGDMRFFDQSQSNGNYYPYRTVHILEAAWWSGSIRYLFGLVTHAILYMSLAKWIATFFSLQLNSQMKAMIGSDHQYSGTLHCSTNGYGLAYDIHWNKPSSGWLPDLVFDDACFCFCLQ